MPKFPLVFARQQRVVFASLYSSSSPIRGIQYGAIPSGGLDKPNTVWIDTRLLQDPSSIAAVVSCLAVSSHVFTSPTYFQTDFPGQRIEGASFGLALLVEMLYPGWAPDIAFTGYVSPLSPEDWTISIHDVNHVGLKVQAAFDQGVKIVAPRDNSLLQAFPTISGRSFFLFNSTRQQIEETPPLIVAATFCEAICLVQQFFPC
jgi:hypothetical protein